MAARKSFQEKTPQKKRSIAKMAVLFWLAFAVVMAGLFIYSRSRIQETLHNSRFIERLQQKEQEPAPNLQAPELTEPELTEMQPQEPQVQPDAQAAPETPATPETPAQPPAREMRQRAVYFMQIERDGAITRVKGERSLPLSNSPMVDVLQALLAGPTDDEKKAGMISLIPSGVKVLSAAVRGATAYINFSEEFQFNSYGAEGYAAQLRQIVWTVTEFPTVQEVQVLIEGRRTDYLGEGIWIGSPINREML